MRKINFALVATASAGLAAGALVLAPAASSASLRTGPAQPAVQRNLQPPPRAGKGWTIQPTPTISSSYWGIASIQLTGVSCASASSCTSVGSYFYVYGHGRAHGPQGGTLAEHWNGSKWKVQATPSPSRFSTLTGVSCASATRCTAVGYTYGGGTLAEHWNGRKWTIQATRSPSSSSGLTGVSCASATRCTAVGSTGSGTLAERWNGRKWTIQATRSPSSSSGLTGVSCASATRCTAVGSSAGGTLAERWNGRKWTIQATRSPSSSSGLTGVSCASATRCTAVGNSAGGTLAERWNGRKWTIQATPIQPSTGSYFASVSCVSVTSCAATGVGIDKVSGNPLALAERWNGRSWRIQATPNPAEPAIGLYGVSCDSAISCTAVGSYYTGGATEFFFSLAEHWQG